MTKLRTIVADDIPASLRTIVGLLGDRCEVVATARDGYEALDVIQRFDPDLAVLDIGMPGLNGLEVARRAAIQWPKLGIIICTVRQEQDFINAAAKAGARGYVFKMNLYQDLHLAVDAVAAGGVFWSTRQR